MNSATKGRLLGLAGLSVFAVWITFSLGSSLSLCLESLTWPTVPVQVVSSSLNTGESNAGRWWEPAVAYSYRLNGHTYSASNLRFMMPPIYQEDGARQIQAEYPEGTRATAAYNPRNPSQSVLEPGIPPTMWWRTLIPLFFWGLLAYLYYEIRHPKRRFVLLPDFEPAQDEPAQDKAA
jgi:Protein of unknown function (DUF3592)